MYYILKKIKLGKLKYNYSIMAKKFALICPDPRKLNYINLIKYYI